MTYDEALQALERAQSDAWDYAMHDGITQAIEVFKRMNTDLKQCRADLEKQEFLWEGGV